MLFVVFLNLLFFVYSSPYTVTFPKTFSIDGELTNNDTTSVFFDKESARFYQEFNNGKIVKKTWAFCDNLRGYPYQFHKLRNGQVTNPDQKCYQLYQAPDSKGHFFDGCGGVAKSCKALFESNGNYPVEVFGGLSCIGLNDELKWNYTNGALAATSGDCGRCSCSQLEMKFVASPDNLSILPTTYTTISRQNIPRAGCVVNKRVESYSRYSFQKPSPSDIEKKLFQTCGISDIPPPPTIPTKQLIAFGNGYGIGNVFTISPLTGKVDCLFKGVSSLDRSPYQIIPIPNTNTAFFYGNGYGWVDASKGTVRHYQIPSGLNLDLWSATPAPNAPETVAYAVALKRGFHRTYYILKLQPGHSKNISVVFEFDDDEGVKPGYQKIPSLFFKKDLKTLYILGASGLINVDVSSNTWSIRKVTVFKELGLYLTNGILDEKSNLLYGIHPAVFGNCSLGIMDPETGKPVKGDGVYVSSYCDISSCSMVPGDSVLSCLSTRGSKILHIDVKTHVLIQSGKINYSKDQIQGGTPSFIYYPSSNNLPVRGC